MKRTSLCMVLLALTPGLAEAYHYVSPRYRVQYSPYALNYRHSGLVPGGLDYSSHALSYSGSGLVFEGVRYTPYALSYRNSGLILDYYAYPVPYSQPLRIDVHCYCSGPAAAPQPSRSYLSSSMPQTSRRYSSRPPSRSGAAPGESGAMKQQDGLDVIRQHLQVRGIDGAGIDRILRIDNELVSADFTLRDRNLIIKYWNPRQIEQLSAKEAVKRRVYEKYKQDWENLARQHRQNGGEIHYVEASDAQTIIAALDSCQKLNGTTAQPVYAKN